MPPFKAWAHAVWACIQGYEEPPLTPPSSSSSRGSNTGARQGHQGGGSSGSKGEALPPSIDVGPLSKQVGLCWFRVWLADGARG